MQYEIDVEALKIKEDVERTINDYLDLKYSNRIILKNSRNESETINRLKELINKLEKLDKNKGKKVWITT